jgi:hypothetical protein
MLTLLLFLIIALPCSAQGDKPKPNTLTPKEIADGWILLFDGETAFGWKADFVPKEGKWTIADGVLQAKSVYSITCTTEFPSFEMHFEYKHSSKKPACVGLKKTLSDGVQGCHFQYELDQAAEWTPIFFRLRDRAIEIEGPGFKHKSRWGYYLHPLISFDPVYDMQLRNIKLRLLNAKSKEPEA